MKRKGARGTKILFHKLRKQRINEQFREMKIKSSIHSFAHFSE